jgi:hypothetical protein
MNIIKQITELVKTWSSGCDCVVELVIIVADVLDALQLSIFGANYNTTEETGAPPPPQVIEGRCRSKLELSERLSCLVVPG